MNGLELIRNGLAPQVRRDPDGVYREVRAPRAVTWAEVTQALKAQAAPARKEAVR